jgi:hypothetical protein
VDVDVSATVTDPPLKRRIQEVLVVHDATCGACSGIARELPAVLRVPVRLRSCRDPDLPALPLAARACRAPAVGVVRGDGTVRWRLGLRAAPALLLLVRPRAFPRSVAVFAVALRARRRAPRSRTADVGP